LQNGESLVHGRHELRGEDDRGIFLGRYFCHGLERTQLQRHEVRRNNVGSLAQFYGGWNSPASRSKTQQVAPNGARTFPEA
jgi:hypothetical protein